MASKTAIEWADRTWNPLRGCSRVSEGCRNCYAERVAARFSGPGQPYEGLVQFGARGPLWTGRVDFVESALAEPARWRVPARVFVNSMSDLYHLAVTEEHHARIEAVMAAAAHHTYLVLTKRPTVAASSFRAARLPHVHVGVSAEDQATLDERVGLLRAAGEAWPHGSAWLSLEPLLAPVELDLAGKHRGVHWVVVGGESGAHARPCDPAWIAPVVAACRAAGVPCFVKQLGSRPVGLRLRGKGTDPEAWPEELRVRELGP